MSIQEMKLDMNATIGLQMGGKGKQITDQRVGSRGLSWIRPGMMQQVLSSIALSQEKGTQMELLELFPESFSEKQNTTELTIIYNGAVQVYHVSADKAEAVMKLANSGSSFSERATLKLSHSENQHSKKLTAGLPMARKLSLQRFLQKRKDRLGSMSPYADNKAGLKASAGEDGDQFQQISLSLSFPSQRSG